MLVQSRRRRVAVFPSSHGRALHFNSGDRVAPDTSPECVSDPETFKALSTERIRNAEEGQQKHTHGRQR